MNLQELEDLAKEIEIEISAGQEAWSKLAKLQAERKAVAVLIKRFTPAVTTTNSTGRSNP